MAHIHNLLPEFLHMTIEHPSTWIFMQRKQQRRLHYGGSGERVLPELNDHMIKESHFVTAVAMWKQVLLAALGYH